VACGRLASPATPPGVQLFSVQWPQFSRLPFACLTQIWLQGKKQKKKQKKASSQQELTPNAKRDASLVRTPVVARTKSSDQ